MGDVSKRILLGRKLRSSSWETLLPKRIALPVFASDALSSVAYAPDEVFIMLSLAGASAYVWSWKIGIAVALVMAAVVASYRQTVHATQRRRRLRRSRRSAWGDGRPDRGVGAPGRLRADGRGVDLVGSAVRRLGDRSAQRSRGELGDAHGPAADGDQSARHRESGTLFAIPTYAFMVAILGMCAMGSPSSRPEPAAGLQRAVRHRAGAGLRATR